MADAAGFGLKSEKRTIAVGGSYGDRFLFLFFSVPFCSGSIGGDGQDGSKQWHHLGSRLHIEVSIEGVVIKSVFP